ncbi:MAG: PAS domain-containing sensor histidine kinase [Phycisphaeraceae bacterium]
MADSTHSSAMYMALSLRFARVLSLLATLLAALALLSWSFELDVVRSPDWASMKANTAVGLTIAGASLMALAWLGERPMCIWLARLGGAVVLVLGALTLSQDLFGWSLGIDQLLFRDAPLAPDTGAPGRMGPSVALSLILAGAAMILLTRGRRSIILAQVLTLVMLVVVLLALIGYAYGVSGFYKIPPSPRYSAMALHSALSLAVLGLALLNLRAPVGPMALLTQRSLGGRLARGLLPLAIALPFALGALHAWVDRGTLVSPTYATALFAVLYILLFALLIDWYARRIGRLDAARQQAQAAERLERQRYQTTLASIADGVIATDRDGRVTFLNAMAETLTGWRLDEAVNRAAEQVFQIVREGSRDPITHPVAIVRRTHAPMELENHTILVARDGSERPIADSAAPIRGEDGQMQGVVLVFQDISTRRRADALQRRLAAIVESSDDAITAKTLDGTLTSWNHGAEKIYGYTAEEAIGSSVKMLVPENRHSEVDAILARIGQGERIDHYETVRRRKDGTEIALSLTVSPIKDEEGRIVGASTIARDITERLQAQLELEQWNRELEQRVAERTAEAEGRARQLEEVARQLSTAEQQERERIARTLHDHLQQLLVAAKMSLSMAQAPAANEAEPIQRAGALIDEAVQASRDLTVELYPPVLFESGLGAALHWLSEHFDRLHQLPVVVDAESNAEPDTGAVRAFLFQAARELLLNVVKHAKCDDGAWVRLQRVDHLARLEVEDHGVGCNPDKALATEARQETLGLHDLRQRANLLGGSLRMETGQGCRVIVEVPLHARNNARKSSAA